MTRIRPSFNDDPAPYERYPREFEAATAGDEIDDEPSYNPEDLEIGGAQSSLGLVTEP